MTKSEKELEKALKKLEKSLDKLEKTYKQLGKGGKAFIDKGCEKILEELEDEKQD